VACVGIGRARRPGFDDLQDAEVPLRVVRVRNRQCVADPPGRGRHAVIARGVEAEEDEVLGRSVVRGVAQARCPTRRDLFLPCMVEIVRIREREGVLPLPHGVLTHAVPSTRKIVESRRVRLGRGSRRRERQREERGADKCKVRSHMNVLR